MSAQTLSLNISNAMVQSGIVHDTLPINTRDGLSLDLAEARRFGVRWAAQYDAADPYPHIVIDGFLPADLADMALSNFPSGTRASDVVYVDRPFEHRKRQILPTDCNESVRRLFDFFNSAPVLAFLEGLTGIEGLISDPYFDGGGFHEISRGGLLGLHADFRINRKLRLNRRLNLLVYLNKDWQESYGGHLEIWDKTGKRRVHRIAPLFNRCVVFNTNKDSYHGHPDPLSAPEHLTRKSMALYYYTPRNGLCGTARRWRRHQARSVKNEVENIPQLAGAVAAHSLPIIEIVEAPHEAPGVGLKLDARKAVRSTTRIPWPAAETAAFSPARTYSQVHRPAASAMPRRTRRRD